MNKSWNKLSEKENTLVSGNCCCSFGSGLQCRPIVSECFLLGGGSAGEISGQVTLLYTNATYKLMQFSQPQPMGLKTQVLLR